MKDALLIAGLGPAHLSQNDQNESFFSYANPPFEKYILAGYSYAPTHLMVEENSGTRQLFTERKEAQLIVDTLKTVFNQERIDYDFLHIKELWAGHPRTRETYKVICLSASFMWSEYMLRYAVEWVCNNFEFDYLIVGGQYAALKRDFIMREFSAVSFVSFGDADISLIPLLRCIFSGNENYAQIPALCYRSGEEIITNPFAKCNIDSPFLPTFEEHYDMIPYVAMRGCPYHCGFCAQSNAFPCWQVRSAQMVVEDFKCYRAAGYRHIDIHDSTFFVPYQKALEFMDGVKELGVTWSANCRADTPFTQSHLQLLEEAGCSDLYVGFEAMSNQVLEYMNKKTTVAHNRRINALFQNSFVNMTASIIVGFPGETKADHELTRRYLLNEHVGFFTVTVFEFESKEMPVWKEREKFDLKVYNDRYDGFTWQHGGVEWSHSGMTSSEAKSLRRKMIEDIRRSDDSLAVMRSWQYRFLFPYIRGKNKRETMRIEKLLDRLVYLPHDYPIQEERKKALAMIVDELKQYGIVGKKL